MSAVRPASCAAAVLVLLTMQTAAHAQSDAAQDKTAAAPSAARRREAPRPTLRLALSVLEGFGRTSVAGADAVEQDKRDDLLGDGAYSEAQGTLVYTRQTLHSLFNAGLSASGVYDGRTRRVTATTQGASIGFTRDIGRTQLQASQSASYSPSLFFRWAPAEIESAAKDLAARVNGAAFDAATYSLASSATVTRSFGRGTSVAAAYSRRSTQVAGGPFSFVTQGGGIRLMHELSSGASLRAGYGREIAQFGIGSAEVDNVDLGLDYERTLPFAKRTRVTVSSGASVTTVEGAARSGLVGRAVIDHPFGRSWLARLSYERGVQLREGLLQPMVADALAAGIEGALGRRIELLATAGALLGAVGPGGRDNRYFGYNGLARVRVALTRRVSFDAQYYTQLSQFGESAELSSFIVRRMNQQGARVGVSVTAPLLRERRVPAPRRRDGARRR
jgi:hypothetical protein